MNSGASAGKLEFGLIDQANRIRMVLVFYLALVALLDRAQPGGIGLLAYCAVALAALASVWSHFFFRWDELLLRGHLRLGVSLLLLFDVGWITLFALATGGAASPYWALLLLPVVFSAFFFVNSGLTLPLTAVLVACVLGALTAATSEAQWADVRTLAARLLALISLAWFAAGLAAVLHRDRWVHHYIVNHLTEGILMVGRDGRVLAANPEFAQLCGRQPGEFLNRNLADLAKPTSFAVGRELLADVAQRPAGIKTRDVLLEGVGITDLRVSTIPCEDDQGQGVGWLVLVQDLSDVRAQTREREQGLSFVSHELRSPLACLRAITEALNRSGGDLEAGVYQRALATIENETDRLSRLVSELTEVARVEEPAYTVEKRPVALDEIVGPVVDLFAARARQQGVLLRYHLPTAAPRVIGDPDRVTQILTNLVDNALKHTFEGGRVEISVCAGALRAEIRVSDSGTGIPPAELERIFDKFAQVGGRTATLSPSAGLGLGLYVSRLLARKQGGELTVQSTPGEGSTLGLILPLCVPARQPATPVAAAGISAEAVA